jgi:prepilin-type N-terminal cleavage/methylation domain-containing protein
MSGRQSIRGKANSGFTLIELLIVIAIILILIAIALPNFLAAQARAKVSREQSDVRTLSIAIESLRIDYGFLLVDFWDDDVSQIIMARFVGGGYGFSVGEPPRFKACCGWHRGDLRGGTTGLFAPLTTPIPYIKQVPPDPFAFELGDQDLIRQDTLSPISYMYHDHERADMKLRAKEYQGVFGCFVPGACPPGMHGITRPLGEDHYYLVGFGPDMQRNDAIPIPYAPTNGVQSIGDVILRSDGKIGG